MKITLVSITSWITIEAVLASMQATSTSQCTLNNCIVPNGKTLNDMCILTLSFAECVNISLVQNNNCRIPVRRDWELRLSDIEQLIQDQGCFKNGQAIGQLFGQSGMIVLFASLVAMKHPFF